MGKGDKKTRRGKIIMGSYGVLRPKKKGSKYIPEGNKKVKKSKETANKEEKEIKEPAEKKPVAKKTATKKPATKKPASKKAEVNAEEESQDSK